MFNEIKSRHISTPWGVSDHEAKKAEGITLYETPGHGGYKVSAKRMKAIQSKFPGLKTFAGGNWFEEDCDWAYVVATFPELWDTKTIEIANETVKRYYEKAI